MSRASLATLVAVTALAPLFAGLVHTLAARLSSRRGPSLLRPYRELMWHASRRSPAPTHTIPLAALALAAAAAATTVLPGLHGGALGRDVLLFAGLLTLARAATGLAALGFRRTGAELTLGRDLARMLGTEPAILLALLAATRSAAAGSGPLDGTARAVAAVALALAAWLTAHRREPWAPSGGLAPATASPLQATTLTGAPRACLELGSEVRQLTLWTAWLIAFLPWGTGLGARPALALLVVVAGLSIVAAAIAAAEVHLVRGRLLDAGGLPTVALSLGAVALLLATLGGR